MKTFTGEHIRNIGIGGHSGSGKTSLTEAMLFALGEITRIGTVEQGNTVSDYNEDEIERQISINTSLLHGVWKNNKINLVDTPGFSDFFGDVVSGMRAVDTMMIVVSAAAGVEVGTERVRELADKYNLPRFYVINKLDRENISFEEVLEQLRERFGKKLTPVQLPVEVGPNFFNIVDIIRQKAYHYATDRSGKVTEEEIPGNLADRVAELRTELIEAVAESDDELLEKYFEAGELTEEELIAGFKNAIRNRLIVPVVCASATHNVGIRGLLDFIVDYLPAPTEMPPIHSESGDERKPEDSEPLAALVFKTVSEAHMGELSYVRVFSGVMRSGDEAFNPNQERTERIGQMYVLNGKHKEGIEELHAGDIGALVKLKGTHTGDTLCDKSKPFVIPPIEFPEPLIEIAIVPKSKGDEEKISGGLHALHEEDPTFLVRYDPELKQTIVSGQGEMHLNIILKRLQQKYGVDVDVTEPKIPYRETIKGKAEAQGKYKKQTGGRGQYGDAHLRLEPLPRGSGFEFVDAIVGGVIPGKFIPAVEKGARETCQQGVLAGYPVVDVKVTCFFGSYHSVDSSEMAFKIASSMAFKKAFMEAKPVLLEPIYKLEVKVPEEYMGDVMGDINSRRGKILGMDSDGRFQIIKALVPLAELHKYSTALRSMTQGQGIFHREFSHYEEVPPDIAQKIIEQAQKEKEEG
ncbi:MAG: elongation factor G [Calditrichaeota bacterium]|nr:MAG: elongation factor G [Calditrichota bacterium]